MQVCIQHLHHARCSSFPEYSSDGSGGSKSFSESNFGSASSGKYGLNVIGKDEGSKGSGEGKEEKASGGGMTGLFIAGA